MKLYIVRHADAEDESESGDFSRDLTSKGVLQAESLGIFLKDLKIFPLTVISSPFLRSHKTAEIICKNLSSDLLFNIDERAACGMSPESGCSLLYDFHTDDSNILLVGHSPDLNKLISYLIGAELSSIEMKKSSLACLDVSKIGFGGSVLKFLLPPKLFLIGLP